MKLTGKAGIFTALAGSMAILLSFAAQSKPFRQPVFAMGTATESDRSSAESEAKDNAESELFCGGSLENVTTHGTGCVKTGDDDNVQYVCTATAKGTCVIGN